MNCGPHQETEERADQAGGGGDTKLEAEEVGHGLGGDHGGVLEQGDVEVVGDKQGQHQVQGARGQDGRPGVRKCRGQKVIQGQA